MAIPRRAGADDVRLDLLDFLLGQTRSIASVDRLLAKGIPYDAFLEFTLDQLPVEQFVELWSAHLPRLVVEARRRGIGLPDPAGYRPYPIGNWIDSEIDTED